MQLVCGFCRSYLCRGGLVRAASGCRAVRIVRPRFAVGELTSDGTRSTRIHESEGQNGAVDVAEGRREQTASRCDQCRTEGNQGNEGGELGLRRRRIRAGKVGVVPIRPAALARGATTENG